AAGALAARDRAGLARPGTGGHAAAALGADRREALVARAARGADRLLPAASVPAGVGRYAIRIDHAGRPARLAVCRALERRAGLGGRARAGPRVVAGPGRRAHVPDAALGRAHDTGVAAVALAGAGPVAHPRPSAARLVL